MSRAHMSLLLLLGLQVLITFGLYVNKNNRDETPKPQPLMAFNAQTIDRFEIITPDSVMTLVKMNQKWHDTAQKNMPLNSELIMTALKGLETVKVQWPTTEDTKRKAQFKVDDTLFNKKIKLYQQDQMVAEVYLGYKFSRHQTYVRRPNEHSIYLAQLPSSRYSVRLNDWLDKSLLRLPEIFEIKTSSYVLKRDVNTWTLNAENQADLPNESMDPNFLQSYANTLKTLEVQGIAETSIDFTKDADFDLEVLGERVWRYVFAKHADKFFVKRDQMQQAFQISKKDFEKLMQLR
jgi:hypothetical protein